MGSSFDLAMVADLRFGRGRATQSAPALAGLGVRHALLVTGRSTERAAPIRAALQAAGVAVTSFAVTEEPSVDIVREALKTLRANGCDGVLGFGGGSALDVAKAVAILAGNDSDPMDHLEVIGRGEPLTRPALPWIAVPTTAGTGSEVTRNAVLAAGEVKVSLRSPLMLARLAIVDPDLLIGSPPATLAASGLDALAQLIEPFLSVRANPVTDALARDGIVRSARSLRAAVTQGLDDDPDRRDDLALASLAGGLCLANAGLGAVHGLAGVLGGRLRAPHGALCAALLAATLETNRAALADRAPNHPAAGRFDELAVLLTGRPEARAVDGEDWLRDLIAALGVPSLTSFGLSQADLPAVVAASQQASSMKANPIPLSDAELTEILSRS